jgi:hypothetical protein
MMMMMMMMKMMKMMMIELPGPNIQPAGMRDEAHRCDTSGTFAPI